MHEDARMRKAIEIAWKAGCTLGEHWASGWSLEEVLDAYSADPSLVPIPDGTDHNLMTNSKVWWSAAIARLCGAAPSNGDGLQLSPNLILTANAVLVEYYQPRLETGDTFGYTLTAFTEHSISASVAAFRPYWKDEVLEARVSICNGHQRVDRVSPYSGRWFTDATIRGLQNVLLAFVPQSDFKAFDEALDRVTQMGRHGTMLENHLALVFGKA